MVQDNAAWLVPPGMAHGITLWRVGLAALGLLTLAASPAWAQQAGSSCKRTLTVAYYDAGSFYDPAAGGGIDSDVMHELSRRTGCRFDEQFLSRGLVFMAFEHGKLDIATSAIPSPERLKYGAHAPFLRTRNELITRTNHDVPATPQAFLADGKLRLGIINRYIYGPQWDEWVAALRKEHRVEVVGDVHQLMRLLDAGRIDAFPAVPVSSGVNVNLDGPRPGLRHQAWFPDAPYNASGLLLSLERLDADTRALLCHALHEMQSDGTLLAIVQRYVPDRKAAQGMLLPVK